jgi:tetratricopeptide (TPR) repeat protein
MRAYVFTDPAMAKVSDRFVWLAINTELPKNRGFVERFPIDNWPSLFVLDPKTEQPVRKWLGSATVPELVARLEDVEKGSTPDAALARAGRLNAKGDHAGAVAAYRQALAEAPAGWAQRPQAVEGLAFGLQATGANAACVQLAAAELDHLTGTPLANVAEVGLMCALELPKGAPLAAKEPMLEEKVAALAQDPSVSLLADDRSGLYDTLVSAREARGDTDGMKAAARAWRDFLDGEAARAKTPADRAVFDSHRLSADLALGEPAHAIPMLEASERDFPEDYNAPARLALVYLRMKEPEKALEASRRAEAKVYGPRSISVLLNEARALVQLGRKAEAGQVFDKAASIASALSEAQNGPLLKKRVLAAREKLLGAKG